MKEILGDSKLSQREEFVSELVDLFFRANGSKQETIKFEDLTSYLIEHEIESVDGINDHSNFTYTESPITDQTTHNNYIEKIYYF